MSSRFKIKSTIGSGGYMVADDLDDAKVKEGIRALARRRTREDIEHLDSLGMPPDAKKTRIMVPYNIRCHKCHTIIPQMKKLQCWFWKSKEKYLGRFPIYQLSFVCGNNNGQVQCTNSIKLLTNPAETPMGYDVSSGGEAMNKPETKKKKLLGDNDDSENDGEENENENDDENENNNVMSLEDQMQWLHSETERIDSLGDNYTGDASQIAQIRAEMEHRARQQAESKALMEKAEKEEFRREFEKAKSDLFLFDDSNENENNNNNNTKNSLQIKCEQVNKEYSNALAEAKALLSVFSNQSSNSSSAQTAAAAPSVATTTTSTTATTNKKRRGLASLIG